MKLGPFVLPSSVHPRSPTRTNNVQVKQFQIYFHPSFLPNRQQTEKELKENLAKQHSLIQAAKAKQEEYNNTFKQSTSEKIREKEQKLKEQREAQQKLREQKKIELVSLFVDPILPSHFSLVNFPMCCVTF